MRKKVMRNPMQHQEYHIWDTDDKAEINGFKGRQPISLECVRGTMGVKGAT